MADNFSPTGYWMHYRCLLRRNGPGTNYDTAREYHYPIVGWSESGEPLVVALDGYRVLANAFNPLAVENGIVVGAWAYPFPLPAGDR